MTDLTKEIAQLEQMKADLEEREYLKQKVKLMNCKIRERKAELQRQHGPKIETSVQKIEKELDAKINQNLNRWKLIGLVFCTLITIILVAVYFKLDYPEASSEICEALNASNTKPLWKYIGVGAPIFVGYLIAVILVCYAVFGLIGMIWGDTIKDGARHRLRWKNADRLAEARARDEQACSDLEQTLGKIFEADPALKAYQEKIDQLDHTQSNITQKIISNDVLGEMDKSLKSVEFVLSQLKNKEADSITVALQRYNEKNGNAESKRDREEQ